MEVRMSVSPRPARAFAALALTRALAALALTGALLAPPGPAASDALHEAAFGDLCGYYRSQARGQGLDHYTTEALWACQALAARKAAGMPLSDRMQAVAFALEQFREAMAEERAARYPRTGGPGVPTRVARERAREIVAEESGMLAALEAVRTGF
jgi:hypothetical protein